MEMLMSDDDFRRDYLVLDKYVANESEVVELAEEWQTAAMTLVKAVEMARTRNDCRTAWMAKKGVSQ